jgi:hypothetical protein
MGKVKSSRGRNRLGNPHHHYHKPWMLQKACPVLKKLIAPDRPSLRSPSRDHVIPFETLRRWTLKLKENPVWTLKDTRWGIHRRIFTEDEEEAIAREIRQHYMINHRLFTSDDFQTLSIDRHLQKFLNAESILHFVGSSSFIRGFMARNRFSQRRQHFKRRPSVDPDDVSR